MSAIQTPWENLKWGLGKCLLLIRPKGEKKRYIPKPGRKGWPKMSQEVMLPQGASGPATEIWLEPRQGTSRPDMPAPGPAPRHPPWANVQVWEMGQPLDQTQGGLRGCREGWPLPCKLGSNPVPIRISGTQLEDHIRTVWCVPVTLSLHRPAVLPPRVLGTGRRP